MSYFCPSSTAVTCLALGLCCHCGLPCGDSRGPAAPDYSENHGSADHYRTDHQGRADRSERPPLVERITQLPQAAASKNTFSDVFLIYVISGEAEENSPHQGR